jgi:hypothetical protein
MSRITLLAGLLALAPVLTGCESFDLDKLDVFGLSDKKKLPGDRKPLFPEGVPGVAQGIPPEYLKGAQQPPPQPDYTQPAAGAQPAAGETGNASQAAAAPPPEETEPPPKPRPKAASKPKPKPKTASAPPPPPAQQPAASRQQQTDWPAPQQQQTPWPAAPAPGTFSR